MVYYKRVSAVPKKLLGLVQSKTQLTEHIHEMVVKLNEPVSLKAGQYVSIKVSEQGMRRSYSVAGVSGDTLEFLIDVSPMGVGSKMILNLLVGHDVEMIGPLGNFVVEPEVLELSRVVFVATGTGVAPFWPMVNEVLEKGFKGEVVLLWGMRHEKDLYWQERWMDLQKKYVNFDFKLILSQPEGGWHGTSGHVGDLVEKLGEFSTSGVFLCGARQMIEEVKKQVLGRGAKDENIYYEKFY